MGLPEPKTEEELCSRFRKFAEREHWVIYPETAGWDMLLVRGGIQVGVEAKLHGNFKVICQALGDGSIRSGPDYRHILVPDCSAEFRRVVQALGLGLWQLWELEWEERKALESVALGWRLPPTPREPRFTVEPNGLIQETVGQIALPDFVPDLAAGVPSPTQLTPWRIKAIELCKILRARGWVTIYDFRRLGIASTIWIQRWLEWTGDTEPATGGSRRVRRYVARNLDELPDITIRGGMVVPIMGQEKSGAERPLVEG